MKSKYLIALFLMLGLATFAGFGHVRAESGSGSDGSSDSSDDDSNDDSDDDGSDDDMNETDDSGMDSEGDLDDSDEDADDDSDDDSSDDSSNDDDSINSGPGSINSGSPMSDDTKKGFFERRSFLDNLEEKREMIRENDGDKEDVRDRMMEDRPRTPGEVRAHFAQAANVGIINLETNIIPRIESRVLKMKSAGIDVSDIEAEIEVAKDKIDDLKAAFESMKELFEGETADKESVKSAGETLKQSMVEVKEALKSVVDSLKSASNPSGATE